ncbi:hypothetical protein GQ600_19741 [Phytophthora cactorum]|nr:hypothetical protein GQ600_19741 [Phytophthora cactorum]
MIQVADEAASASRSSGNGTPLSFFSSYDDGERVVQTIPGVNESSLLPPTDATAGRGDETIGGHASPNVSYAFRYSEQLSKCVRHRVALSTKYRTCTFTDQ